jgi:hypothetical protein
VTIPMDAEPGEVNEVFVFATSQNDQEDPAAEDIATIELKSGLLNFIPLLSTP